MTKKTVFGALALLSAAVAASAWYVYRSSDILASADEDWIGFVWG